MDESLKIETNRLVLSWMQHEPEWLRNYLVQDVEDPRINLQSIFSRHFLVRALTNDRFVGLMEKEYRFSACMNWLNRMAHREISETRDLEVLLHALRQGADNAEGLVVPAFVVRTFASLTAQDREFPIPNYIESFLENTRFIDGKPAPYQPSLDSFQRIWNRALESQDKGDSLAATLKPSGLSVLEPACGSANDYQYLCGYGIAQWLEYTGLDLCAKNIQNARALFPEICFKLGNVFEIAAGDKTFDYCFVHDLFEHLSVEGLAAAVREICRVTRMGVCAGFFSMDEVPEHVVRPVEDYHWNTLSLPRVKELFASHEFAAQVVHLGTFLHQHLGCDENHNPNAYTLLLWRMQ